MSALMARSPLSGRARMLYATSLGAVLVLAFCLVLPAVVKAVPPKRSLGSGRRGHYFVATKDGPNVAFYLDGQLKHSATGAGNAPPTMP